MNELDEYVKRFGENFPVFAPLPKGKTMEQVIEECLKANKPFVPEYKDGAIY